MAKKALLQGTQKVIHEVTDNPLVTLTVKVYTNKAATVHIHTDRHANNPYTHSALLQLDEVVRNLVGIPKEM